MKKKIIIMLIIALAVVSITGCIKDNKETDATTASDDTTQQAQDTAAIKGQMATDNEIENLEGNYYIPIADSWIGKVSYEIIGKQTIIYHITQDMNEPQINPILMNINVSENPDSPLADVFLLIAGLSYYNIPPNDYPYNQGNLDALEFESFMDDIPQLLQSAWLIDDSAWQEEIDQMLDVISPTGQVIEATSITSSDGYFSVDVPASWKNIVSYTLGDGSISFYHITKNDPGAYETNPLLMTISATEGMHENTIDEVYISQGCTFYYTPRFDFPYIDAECADGAVFSLLCDDLLSVLESSKVIQVPTLSLSSPFIKADATVDGLTLGVSTKAQSLAHFAIKPIDIEEITWDATGQTIQIYTFHFGTLTFSEDILIGAKITDPTIYGPRDITVGYFATTIKDKFASTTELSNSDITIYYRENTGNNSSIIIPPYGVKYTGSTDTLVYGCFSDLAYAATMTTTELEEMYIYMVQYTCAFYFDSSGVLTSYSIDLGAQAE